MKSVVGLCTLALVCGARLAVAGDREDVLACIDRYIEYEESGNLLAQGALMTDDRTMVYPGGRLAGDNRRGMREQQAEQDRFAAEFPGVRYEIELRDVSVRTWNGDSALVTFDSIPTRVVPPSLAAEKIARLGAPKIPLIVAVMLVKRDGVWKIVHTTFVPREKD